MTHVVGIDSTIVRFAEFVPRDLATEIIEARKRQVREDRRRIAWTEWVKAFAFAFYEAMEGVPSCLSKFSPPSWAEGLRTCADPTEDLVQALALQLSYAWLAYLSETAGLFARAGDDSGVELDNRLFPSILPESLEPTSLRPTEYLRRMLEDVADEEAIARLLDGFARNVRSHFSGQYETIEFRSAQIRVRAGGFSLLPAA